MANLDYPVNGQIIDGDDQVGRIGFMLYQQIQQWLNYLEEHSFNYTPINFSYDLLTSDNATTTTNFTYEGGGDTYDVDNTVTSGELIIPMTMPNEVTINTAEVVVNNTVYKSYQDNITNPSFESAIGAEWTYSETHADWSGARTSSGIFVGSYIYQFSKPAVDQNGTYCQILQSNVDLTNVDTIGVWTSTSNTDNGNYRFKIIIDSTEVADLNAYTSTTYLTGTIPIGLRTTGKDVILRVYQNNSSSSSTTFNFDYVDIWDSTTKTDVSLSLSADGGSNWESVTEGTLHKFTNTGTELEVKVTYSTTTGAGNAAYMSIQSIGVIYSA